MVLKVRVTRADPDNPDRHITDFEPEIINLEHIKHIQTGVTPDSCWITFPEKERHLVKGSLEQIIEAIDESLMDESAVCLYLAGDGEKGD